MNWNQRQARAATVLGAVLFLQTGFSAAAQTSGSIPGTVVSWGAQVLPSVAPGTRFTKVAAGYYHSLALKSDGTVVAWGYNDNGQCTVPANLSGVIAIAAGGYHSLALKSDGTVVAWGAIINGGGLIWPVPNGLSGVISIAAGGGFSLALKSDGTVVAWGFNDDGAITVPASLNGVIAIATGDWHSLALKSDGTVVAWGSNDYGESTVPANLSGVIAIAAGYYHSLALKSDGTVVAWGNNDYGESTVPANLSGVIAIAAGYYHSLALKSDGTVVAWGYNDYGQSTVPANLSGVLAIAAGEYHSLALKSDGTVVAWGDSYCGLSTVPGGLSGVIAIAAGYYHSLALKSDGTVVAWGDNYDGESTVPANLSGVLAIAAGGYHSLALKSDGTVVAWGYNGYGESTVPANLSGVIAIAAGYYHSLALKSDGTVVARGDNYDGESTVPANLSGVLAIAAGGYHSLALKSDGTVVAWGYNGHGESTVPATLSGVIAIAAGYYHSLALKSDGTVVAWGNNGDGQSTVPASLSGVIAIAAGGYNSLALKSDGTVVAWGYNGYGQSTVPANLSGVLAIAAGRNHSLALVATPNQIQAPVIFGQPANRSVQAGNTVTFTVYASGNPSLNYQWRYNGQNIAGANGATLTLNSVAAPNAGVYSVVVANAYGSVTSALASLVIQGNPANWNPSFVSVAPQSAPADGQPHVTATVTLLDNNYNPLVRKTVQFYARGSSDPIPPPSHPTDNNGQTTTTITSTTPGNVSIGAIDLSDSLPVPNSASVQFTTGSVLPGTDLSSAIEELANSSSDILKNAMASYAVSEGEDGDYFQETMSSDERDNGVSALFTGIGTLITMLGPENDLIKETAMQVAASEGITLVLDVGSIGTSERLDVIANSDTGLTTYGQKIASNNDDYQQSEFQSEQQLLNGVPPAAQDLSSAYASDIALRLHANEDLKAITLAQENLILNLRLQSEQAHIDLLSKAFMPVNMVSTLAQDCIPVYGKEASAALGLAESLDTYAVNRRNLSFAGNAVNSVETAMLNCSYYSRLIDGNTESAFSEIAAAKPPKPITGKMSSVNSVRSYVPASGWEGVAGTLAGWFNGKTYVTTTGAHSDITIQNNNQQTATFSVNAVYWVTTVIKDQLGDALVPITVQYVASTSVTIPANQSAQATLKYFDNGNEAAPDVNQPITIFLLGYDTGE